MTLNIIRNIFPDKIEKLKPLLRSAYQSIFDYQNNRNRENENIMRGYIRKTLPILRLFKDHIPAYKGKYIELLEDEKQLEPYDLMICFDRAIYELHTRAESGYFVDFPWSQTLRDLLNERQKGEVIEIENSKEEIFLTAGLGVSRGSVEGRACIIMNRNDFEKVKPGDIIIAPVTNPDFVEVIHLISGLVTDRGGKVSHAAILAREFNIPCIVGCTNATKVISEGQTIRLDALSGLIMEVK